MPVKFDEYQAGVDGADARIVEDSNAHGILRFLAKHPEIGFTPSEIADALDLPRGSVGPTLQRLDERGLLRHKEPYWSIDKDRLAAYESMLLSMDVIESRSEEEAWSAVDPEEYSVDDGELAAWRDGCRRGDG